MAGMTFPGRLGWRGKRGETGGVSTLSWNVSRVRIFKQQFSVD